MHGSSSTDFIKSLLVSLQRHIFLENKNHFLEAYTQRPDNNGFSS